MAVFATGGFTVAGRSFTRADEFVSVLAVIVALRALAAPLRLREVSPARVAVAGALGYALVMGFIVVTRHLALRTHRDRIPRDRPRQRLDPSSER
jgi:hypothetical protein